MSYCTACRTVFHERDDVPEHHCSVGLVVAAPAPAVKAQATIGTRICPRCGYATMRPGPKAWECGRIIDCGYSEHDMVNRLAPATEPHAEDRAPPDQAVRPAPRPRPEAIDATAVVRFARTAIHEWSLTPSAGTPLDAAMNTLAYTLNAYREAEERAAWKAQAAAEVPAPSGGPAVPQEGHTALEFQQHLALTAIAALRERLREAEALNFDLRLKVRGLQESESDSMKDVTVAKKERDAALARAERAEGALREIRSMSCPAGTDWGHSGILAVCDRVLP